LLFGINLAIAEHKIYVLNLYILQVNVMNKKKKTAILSERYAQEAEEIKILRQSELLGATVIAAENTPQYMMALMPSELRSREIQSRIDVIIKRNLSRNQLIKLLAETQLLLDQNHFAYSSMTRLANINAAHIQRQKNLDSSKLQIGGFSKAESYDEHKEIFNAVYSDLKYKIGMRPRLRVIIDELERLWPNPPPPMRAWSTDTLKIWFKIRNKEEKEYLLASTSRR
jgi:hypothetical protein